MQVWAELHQLAPPWVDFDVGISGINGAKVGNHQAAQLASVTGRRQRRLDPHHQ
jgi:hypothetical protein